MTAIWNALLDNLTFVIVVHPLLGIEAVLIASRWGSEVARRAALANVLITIALCALLVANFDHELADGSAGDAPAQMATRLRWLAEMTPVVGDPTDAQSQQLRVTGPNVQIAVGVDGLSLWFVALTSLAMLPAVLAGWTTHREHPAAYYACLLAFQSAVLGMFAALDVVLFYVCLEFSLVPLFFLIGNWGGYERRRIMRKFVVYNLAGSLLVLGGLIGIVLAHTRMSTSEINPLPQVTFSIEQLIAGDEEAFGITQMNRSYALAGDQWADVQLLIFAALLTGFAIKASLFPFHTWLSPTSGEAPTSASVLLMGVGLQVGGYGFLRFVLPLFPVPLEFYGPWLSAIAVAGVVYAGLLAVAQDDVKKLATCWCIGQAGLCAAGLLSQNAAGISGGTLLLLSQGLTISVVLFLVGALEQRYSTRDAEAFGGLTAKYPRLGFAMLFAALAAVGVPGSAGFAGEWLALLGIYHAGSPLSTLAVTAGMLLFAWAFFWFAQRTLFGPFREPVLSPHFGGSAAGRPTTGVFATSEATSASQPGLNRIGDLSRVELAAIAPLAVVILWIGLYPQFFLSRMEAGDRADESQSQNVEESEMNAESDNLKRDAAAQTDFSTLRLLDSAT